MVTTSSRKMVEMPENMTGEAVADRVQTVINERFDGNASELARRCEKISDGRVTRVHIASILNRNSLPRMDIALVVAEALGVSIEWLAGGIERPRRIISDRPDLEPSIQSEGRPQHPAPFVLETPGRYQFVVDVVVKGPVPERTEDQDVQKG